MLFFFIIVLMLGFFAQYMYGTLGMGYGVSSSSFLVAAGLSPVMVSASVHTSEVFATLVSGISHLKFGNVDRKITLPLTITGIIGGVFGAYFLSSLPSSIVSFLVGIVLLALGIRIFLKFFGKKHVMLTEGEFSQRFLLFLGFVGGMVDAIGGGGWGAICTSTLISVNKTAPKNVIGSVTFARFFTTLAIVFTFGLVLGFGSFLWNIIIPLIIGGVIAGPVAAYTCKKIPSHILGPLVGITLIILNTRTIMVSLPKIF